MREHRKDGCTFRWRNNGGRSPDQAGGLRDPLTGRSMLVQAHDVLVQAHDLAHRLESALAQTHEVDSARQTLSAVVGPVPLEHALAGRIDLPGGQDPQESSRGIEDFQCRGGLRREENAIEVEAKKGFGAGAKRLNAATPASPVLGLMPERSVE